MADSDGKQFVVIRVPNVVDEADFFARVYNSAASEGSDNARQINAGPFVVRIEQADGNERTRGLALEITVNNVNRFTEEVWNRGVKYAKRPQNYRDGFRRVTFVSPGDIRVNGVGPLKTDSTGSFRVYRDGEE